ERTENNSAKRKSRKAANKAKNSTESDSKTLPNLFHQQRQMTAQRSRILSRLLLEL
ncbi:MAG TPA: methyltransferase, partial [Psychrobacter sp.]|nr:methyltransferase [Psychrobacter sp.]